MIWQLWFFARTFLAARIQGFKSREVFKGGTGTSRVFGLID
jgi:hypothetical protein